MLTFFFNRRVCGTFETISICVPKQCLSTKSKHKTIKLDQNNINLWKKYDNFNFVIHINLITFVWLIKFLAVHDRNFMKQKKIYVKFSYNCSLGSLLCSAFSLCVFSFYYCEQLLIAIHSVFSLHVDFVNYFYVICTWAIQIWLIDFSWSFLRF